jgi:RimJ/RimL family protein N-acetyltransferase
MGLFGYLYKKSLKMIPDTERLNIREISEKDLDGIIKLNSDIQVMEFFPKILSYDESKIFLNKLILHQKEFGFSMNSLYLKETNEFVGLTGLIKPSFEADFTNHYEIGWKILPKFWGKGLVVEAARDCLNFGFEVLGEKKIISFTSKLNLKSKRVMEKLAMNYVKNFEHPFIQSSHKLCEHVLFELKKTDWISK